MKSVVILLFMFHGLLLYSQESLSTKKLDSIGFIETSQKILEATKINFQKIDSGKIDYKHYYRYINVDNEREELLIVYTKRVEGGNIDLEIPGELVWNVESIISKYLTIFDLYKKYYSPNADKIKIQDLGQEWSKSQDAASIRRAHMGSAMWEIRIWDEL